MKEYLDLKVYNKHKLIIDYDYLRSIKDELDEFLSNNNYINNKDFAKKVMFNQEIKSNNTIEGINDDLFLIEDVIKNIDSKENRIINLYKGYKYILTHKVMDKEHLRELYSILSKGLLDKSDLNRMGDYYRADTVYILMNGRLDMELDKGLPSELIDEYMDYYFKFINNGNYNNITDEFIKSQILHLYLVMIHPYFDVNGRTSRTMSMWYLLNKKAYPYIIFNRAITFDGSKYDKSILKAKEHANSTFFIKEMMENVKIELEKEYILNEIKNNTNIKLECMDYQTLIYILSMNGEINVLNFASMYNKFNSYKKVKDIYEEILLPLIDSNILKVSRLSNKCMFNDKRNEVLLLNKDNFDISDSNIKRLSLKDKI